jgi:hypothetical protein
MNGEKNSSFIGQVDILGYTVSSRSAMGQLFWGDYTSPHSEFREDHQC